MTIYRPLNYVLGAPRRRQPAAGVGALLARQSAAKLPAISIPIPARGSRYLQRKDMDDSSQKNFETLPDTAPRACCGTARVRGLRPRSRRPWFISTMRPWPARSTRTSASWPSSSPPRNQQPGMERA